MSLLIGFICYRGGFVVLDYLGLEKRAGGFRGNKWTTGAALNLRGGQFRTVGGRGFMVT